MDWDYIYYLYVIELNRAENEFWNSTLAKVFSMIDLHMENKYNDGKEGTVQEQKIGSMKDMPGFF